MRFYPSWFANTNQFIGSQRNNGRVTVEPSWMLNLTGDSYGNSVRGPYRWFQDKDDTGEEWEIPNIKSIEWDRSEDQDIATCTITLYNIWHEGNTEAPELEGQLGKPGYFWPKRGLEVNRWNQIGGKGSYRKDGFWDPNFSWQNVLVPYGLIRTYEGRGGLPTLQNFKSIDDNISNENIFLTGTWLIDNITAGSNGEMILSCKDMGKLLMDQLCFIPTIPSGLYPLEYYPAGKSAFDSVFGPRPKTGVSPGSQGEVRSTYFQSSLDASLSTPDADVNGHKGSHSNDGNWLTYSLSEAHPHPLNEEKVWWEFEINQEISKLSVKAWAGGYDCYVSVNEGGLWQGDDIIPGTGGIPYVKKISIPFAIPDNQEPVIMIQIPEQYLTDGKINADYVRITFDNLYFSGILDGSNVYRGGIRDIIFYREGDNADPYSPDFTTIPWTFSMCSHPTRGYWVCDDAGNVYGFGDAADYDSTAFGAVPLAERSGHSDNQSIAMCSHPDGKGYWVLDRMGHVYAYGSASFHGEYEVPWPGTDQWGEDGLAAWDITPTYTGNGYWVIYGDGRIKGFGDATPNDEVLPWTSVALYMNSVVNERWLYQHQGNGITGHPHKMGFWATTGSGEVRAFGEAEFYGELDQRVYNRGMADEFRLAKTEFTRSIESTPTGNGYWIAFGSGHIAAFGDAVGKGPTFIYPADDTLGVDAPLIAPENLQDWSFFRALVWDIARDPDGTGFWLLIADGSVGSYNAEFWGQPSYNGLSGYRWHEGNWTGDYTEIIKELLLWCGFTFYDPAIGPGDSPEVFGSLESTGIKTDTILTAEKFDKRPILDIIKELIEVVAYRFRVREDGGVQITSPSIWQAGNFDEDGIPIYVVDGTLTRVAKDAVGAVPFIPVIDEEINLFDYQATLTGEPMRSEIIIGTDLPDPKNPASTGFVRHIPRSATEEVRPGVPALRGIPKTALWISQLFTNPEEAALMAELIALQAWFAERTGQATCVANPLLSLGDQVKFIERNTSEYNIHYVRGINSSNNLDSGVWTYNLTTFWLGDKDNWVITADQLNAPVYGPRYYPISERVDRWQQYTGRNLEKGAKSNGSLVDVFDVSGSFKKTLIGSTGADPGGATVSTVYTVPNPITPVSASFPPPPQGGMTYVNQFFDDSDIHNFTQHITLYNDPGATAHIYLQMYDGDIGDGGQYYGLQTQGEIIWLQFGTNDLTHNVTLGSGSTSLAAEELGAPFISIRKVFDTSLKPGDYQIRLARGAFDSTAWSDASYAFGGDWYSMYLTTPDDAEILIGSMRFPRESSGVPAAIHDNGGTWMEAWDNNNDETLYPVEKLHVAVRGVANGSPPVRTTSSYSLMPNVDIWGEEPIGTGLIHHEIGGDTKKYHNAGTLFDVSSSNNNANPAYKVVWSPVDGATSYRVYRGLSLTMDTLIGESETNVIFDKSWDDTPWINGLSYYYGITPIVDGVPGDTFYVQSNNAEVVGDNPSVWNFEGQLTIYGSKDVEFTLETLAPVLGLNPRLSIYSGSSLIATRDFNGVNNKVSVRLGEASTSAVYRYTIEGHTSSYGNGLLSLNVGEGGNILGKAKDTLLVVR